MTNPGGGGSGSGGEIPTAAVAAVTLLILAIVGAVVFLTFIGKPVDNVMILLAALIAPTITSIINTRKLATIQRQVNGKVDNLITDKANLEHQVSSAGMVPVTATVSYDPDTTGPIPVVNAAATNPYGSPVVVPNTAAIPRHAAPPPQQHPKG